MRGIVLAGGAGSRLAPLTAATCKQLLPVFDKPMVYYPLTLLLLAGVREILLVCTPRDREAFERLLGDGSAWGVEISYAVQPSPQGIADALLVGADFLAGSPCLLVLGDNLLYGAGLRTALRDAAQLTQGARVFGYEVADPTAYGVLALDGDKVVDLVEKPEVPPSPWAVPGLYAYDGTAVDRARELRPSARGELEITDLNRSYLRDGALEVSLLGRGVAWLDMGTPEHLHDAAAFVEAIQARQGLRIGCPEEVAWRNGWIDGPQLAALGQALPKTAYGAYLEALAERSP